MKIAIVADTKQKETFGFIKPLLEIESITNIDVYGDEVLDSNPKLRYITPAVKKPTLLKNLFKAAQLFFARGDYDLIWAIYELPHGMIAWLGNLSHRSTTIISIIGNPAYQKIRKGLWKKAMFFLIRNMDYVTVTGSRSKQFLARNRVPENKILILPNSIDTQNLNKKGSSKKYDIVSIGRLSPEKELFIMLEVICALKADLPSIKAAIAGNGPLFNDLQAKINELGLNDCVALPGFVDDKEEFYNSGKVLLLTSSTEGLPRTVIEAMSCQIPAVASEVGDMADVIDNNETGFLVTPFDNIPEYKAKLKTLLNNEDILNSFSQSARRSADRKYSYTAAVSFWNSLLSKIVHAG